MLKNMIIGVDLGGTKVRAGRINNGTIEDRISEPSLADQSMDETIGHLKSMIRKIMRPSVGGIGIGVPSVVDVDNGVVYNVANIPSWKEVHLKDILEEEFNIPVYVNNDCNCFVLGEKHYGKGKSYKDIVGITLGTGVGAGIIINNQLYNGSNTGAGEIGSLPYLGSNFEHYCSSEFFDTFHQINGKEAYERAERGDKEALRIWEEFGNHFGNLIQAVLYTYDPEVIILGGSIANAFPYFRESMSRRISEFPYPETIKNINIFRSDNIDISILGAASLIKK